MWRILAMACGLWVGIGPLRADDWQVERPLAGPRPARDSLPALKALVERQPREGYALRQYLRLARSAPGGLDAQIADYETRATAEPMTAVWPLLLGHLYEAAARYPEAAAAFDRAVTRAPEDPAPCEARAELARRMKDGAAALRAYDEAVKRAKGREERVRLLRLTIDVALELRDKASAGRAYEQWVALEPRNVFVAMDYAAALSRAGMPAEALVVWRDVVARAGRELRVTAMAARELGEVLETLGRDGEALDTYRRALDRLPRGHWAQRELLERLVAVLRRQDRVSAAIAEVERRGTRDFEGMRLLARLYEETGDDARALAALRRTSQLRPSDVGVREDLVRLLSRAGRNDEALGERRALVRLHPREPALHLRLAEQLVRAAQPKEAFAVLERTARAFPNDASVQAQLVDLYLRYNAARERIEAQYRTLIRLEPEEESHIVNLGDYYFGASRREEALATWRKVIELRGGGGSGWLGYADILRDHDLMRDAEAAYREAVRLLPEDAHARRGLAAFLEKERRHADAEREWTAVLGLLPQERRRERQEARAHLLTCLEAQGRLAAAARAWAPVATTSPLEIDQALLLAEARQRLRDPEGARAVFERILEADPAHEEAVGSLERVYAQLGRLTEAAALLERWAANGGKLTLALHRRLADYALQQNKPEEAVQHLRQAVAQAPGEPSGHVALGGMLWRVGSRAEAVAAYEQALQIAPLDHDVAFQLAEAYRDLGRRADEAGLLTRIVGDSRNAQDILKAGRRLLRLDVRVAALAEFERTLLPLAEAATSGGAHRRLLIELYATWLAAAESRLDAPPGDDGDVRRHIAERGLRPVLDALRDEDAGLRLLALGVLERALAVAAVSELTRMLDGKDALLRFRAAVALGRIGSETAVPALARLMRDRSRPLAQAAVWALGRIPVLASRAPLSEVVAGRGFDVRMRTLAALALGARGLPDASEPLVAALRDPVPAVRVAAATALGWIGGLREAGAAFGVRLEREPPDVALAYLWGLTRNPSTAALPTLATRLLTAAPGEEERAALRALLVAGREPSAPAAGHGDEAAAELLAAYDALVDEREAQIRDDRLPLPSSAALGPIEPEERVQRLGALAAVLRPALQAVLRGPDGDAQTRALERLRGHPNALTLRPLVEAGDLDAPGGPHLLVALRDIVTPAEPRIAELARVGPPAVRAAALAVLGRLGGDGVAATIEAELDSPEADVRAAAAEGLAALGTPAARATLRGRATRGLLGWQEARAVCRALSRRPEGEGIDTLGLLGRSAYRAVWQCAVSALARAEQEEALDALAALLPLRPSERAAAAAAALRARPEQRARRLLEQLPNDSPASVRRAARGEF